MKTLVVRISAIAAIAGVAFVAGLTAGRAQTPAMGWGPAVIHVSQLTDADFPAPSQPGAARVKVVGRVDTGVVQVQMGATKKHYHTNSNEVQYILEGSGMFWLGDKQVPVGPGDLIIIPKGTAHGMDVNYKAIAFKSPPQAPDDIHPVP
jgi:mannose-6-phosphate isomerase-like protein (cupin superfamily)